MTSENVKLTPWLFQHWGFSLHVYNVKNEYVIKLSQAISVSHFWFLCVLHVEKKRKKIVFVIVHNSRAPFYLPFNSSDWQILVIYSELVIY